MLNVAPIANAGLADIRARAIASVNLTLRPPSPFTKTTRHAGRSGKLNRAPAWTRLVRLGLEGDTRAGVDGYRSLVRWQHRHFPSMTKGGAP